MRALVPAFLVFLAATACSGTEEHRCPAVGCAFGAMIRITPPPKGAVITVCRNAKCASATSTGVYASVFEGDIRVEVPWDRERRVAAQRGDGHQGERL